MIMLLHCTYTKFVLLLLHCTCNKLVFVAALYLY